MLLEVKISDQYLNILSILRGDAVNNQYKYLQGRESIFLVILSCHCPPSPAASRSPWQCFAGSGFLFLENPRRCRAPASSVDERSFPARPGTGGTESTRATGKVAAELRVVTRTSMLAGPLRPAASNHPFLTHRCPYAAYLAL